MGIAKAQCGKDEREIAFSPVDLALGALVLRDGLQQCFDRGAGEGLGERLSQLGSSVLSPGQRRSSGRASGQTTGTRTYAESPARPPRGHPAPPPCVVAELASRAIPDEVGAGDADQDVDHHPAALRSQLVNGHRNLTSCRRIPLFVALPQADPQHQGRKYVFFAKGYVVCDWGRDERRR